MHVVRLPRLGQTMESGIITAWHVDEGAAFSVGDPLYEVETDKMSSEVEAKQAGVLVRIVARTGPTDIPVGAVLAVTAAPDETFSDAAIDALLAGTGQENQADISPATPADDATESSERPGAPLAVPKARALAREHGVDLTTIAGSGIDGVIRVADVESLRAPETVNRTSEEADAPARGSAPRVSERIPVQGIARAMAEAMSRSWTEIPQFVQQVTADATALVARLKRLRYEGVTVSYTDLLIAAVALTAVDVPEVNSTFAGEEIVRFADVNVSVAMATDRGLVVPVVHHANARTVAEIAATTKSLADKARSGRLGEAEMSGGTITLSNLGAVGIDTGVPLINAPQCALVFVGSMTDQAVVVDGAIVIRKQLNLAISYDHRVVDGMTAAGFTTALRSRIEAGG